MVYYPNINKPPSIPAKSTFVEIGRISTAWAYLDSCTSVLFFGMMEANEKTISILNTKFEPRSKWEMIQKLTSEFYPEKLQQIKSISKNVGTVASDRNIVVKGIINANMGDNASYWTVWKGSNAGKRYPVSTNAAEIIRKNIQKVARSIDCINTELGFKDSQEYIDVNEDWPKPL